MAKKKDNKPKEPVKVRFKELANGNRSIYLDIYNNGKRSYEFLRMYLIPEVDEAAKKQNENALKAANFVKSQRIIQLTNDEAGIIKKDGVRSKIKLFDFMEDFERRKRDSGQSESNSYTIDKMIKHLKQYHKTDIPLVNVDEAFCKGFIHYLLNAKVIYGIKDQVSKQISKSTAYLYFSFFSAALNEAVRRKFISVNPIKSLGSDERRLLNPTPAQRGYLTLDEVQKLIDTEYKRPQTKQAFLFAIFCGLRISDIRNLRWDDLVCDGNNWMISIVMTKTRQQLYLPLSEEAIRWLPDRTEAGRNGLVFSKLPETRSGLNLQIKKWVKAAGIEKDVCFHMSRHTFATSLLTLGADLYTTSKLLGHKNIATTQIYAEIVNQKKVDAVNLMCNAFSRKEE